MENKISFKQLVQKTCLKIIVEFLIAILVLYLLPLLSISIKVPGEETAYPVFLNIFSWIYICIALLVIVSLNIRQLLLKIHKEMNIVYHQSMWLESTDLTESLTIREFLETNQKINQMQHQIEGMLENERKQKEALAFKVSAASHDLKTPLTVIQGNSELLSQSAIEGKYLPYIQDIHIASNRIIEYINRLLLYSKTYYENENEWKEYSLEDVIESIDQEIHYLLKDKSIVTFQYDEQIDKNTTVYLHLNYVLRAVMNMMQNALEYSQADKKSIKVYLQYTHQQLLISVWNNGAHLTEETLQHADSLFYRNDKNRNLNDAHFGIGLAFVKRVSELHHGILEIKNEDDGVKVTISIHTGLSKK
ncbi:HAMP domain-containing sensor histidine kinase [uncultured Granulicatella sp.]|uniref:sensor histidine kinase n=1 Tax=uncultured Granulicatella sp. TaxID=316089 RepID=UPI0028DC3C97|nr:HAMP domain-containing sensor histidine kinase [uncultured Granulicatella sp.]